MNMSSKKTKNRDQSFRQAGDWLSHWFTAIVTVSRHCFNNTLANFKWKIFWHLFYHLLWRVAWKQCISWL